MLVIRHPDQTCLIAHQADHAATSAAAAELWRRPARLPEEIWPRFLRAVHWHDDGWIEAEKQVGLKGDGLPYDFMSVPTAEHVAIWRRSMALALSRDPYAGLLVAHHARRLYTSRPAEANASDRRLADQFIQDSAILIDQLLEYLSGGTPPERAAVDPRNLMVAVRLLSALDSLTLMLAGALPLTCRTETLCFGDDQAALAVHRDADDPTRVTLDPWPFEPATVRLEMKAQQWVAGARLGAAPGDGDVAQPVTLAWSLRPK
jgi:hypothetical protein